MAQSKILCVVPDENVKRRWSMALVAEGHEVVATRIPKHAQQLLRAEPFNLVVIGFGSTQYEKESLAESARNKYKIPVLVICALTSDFLITANRHLPATVGDDSLVRVATTLARDSQAESFHLARKAAA